MTSDDPGTPGGPRTPQGSGLSVLAAVPGAETAPVRSRAEPGRMPAEAAPAVIAAPAGRAPQEEG
ncbi:hypothetical protein Ppa06_43060 [Planomonospora parontospora subsp. parontospora]|uniref:Uncharacterized protein n=2 Tax=Planomonospora parontospora TaxID=58119 RepID=A0AA37BKE6_9ACTN|nr:hypothetical protein [Planomonospora parontospora]GGK83810.1 hypothetical protein GCM10010126_48910 [Planomonospora parontospora]GII10508.1 hypothetical protein Ppa06_43060 [Planomonospora parontospora subsp. parontospora]